MKNKFLHGGPVFVEKTEIRKITIRYATLSKRAPSLRRGLLGGWLHRATRRLLLQMGFPGAARWATSWANAGNAPIPLGIF